MNKLTKSYIKSLLKPRKASSDKSNHGHALLIAGSAGYMGAAVIAAKAGLRSGSGLLTVNVPSDERFVLQSTVPEAMVMMRENRECKFDRFSSIGIGPGIGTDKEPEEWLKNVLKNSKALLLLDADALTIISNNNALFREIPEETIITPHHREFDRLFGIHETLEDRINTAMQMAGKYNIIIVLKGHRTAIVSPKKIFYNSTGNAGLAKGGSGDALTGVITSFLAQGYAPLDAANLGVYFHGLAADITLKRQSAESMIITDIIDNFGRAFNSIRS